MARPISILEVFYTGIKIRGSAEKDIPSSSAHPTTSTQLTKKKRASISGDPLFSFRAIKLKVMVSGKLN